MNLAFVLVFLAALPNPLTKKEMAKFERPTTTPVYNAPAEVRQQQMATNQQTFSVLIRPVIVQPAPVYYRAQAPGASMYWRMHYRRAYQIQRLQLERQRLYYEYTRPRYYHYPYYYNRYHYGW